MAEDRWVEIVDSIDDRGWDRLAEIDRQMAEDEAAAEETLASLDGAT